MSEYWKSNPRKFCDFCKCWIADNKPSVEFHERGKKHKENVEKKLDIIAKQGKEDYKNKLKVDDYMKAMEKAALVAYKKDLELNPDMTGSKITEMARATNAKIVIGSQEVNFSSKIEMKKDIKWQEVKSEDGSSYYWNTETQETMWERPKNGFISLSQQKKKEKKIFEKSEKSKLGSKQPFNKLKSSKHIKKKSTTVFQPKPLPPVKYGPEQKGQPFGRWKTAFEPTKEIDLQLPSVPEADYCLPELIMKRPKVTFTEKTVTLEKESFSTDEPVMFKKRKGSEDHRKNVRRRIDD